MREIATHKVNGLNDSLTITVVDEPGEGNACHVYAITTDAGGTHPIIRFQKGPIAENGVNGISNEALLAIVRDRLEGFQSGKYACTENAYALDNVKSAMDVLATRTRHRVERGVEGTSVV